MKAKLLIALALLGEFFGFALGLLGALIIIVSVLFYVSVDCVKADDGSFSCHSEAK